MIGSASPGSGLPGRFRNSESVTSYVLTSLPLGGDATVRRYLNDICAIIEVCR